MTSHFPNIYSDFRTNLQKFQRTRHCTKKSETWCVFLLCATAKEKNIKKIFEKKSQKKEQHINRKASVLCTSVIILPQACFLLHLDTCISFLVPWSNCSITFSWPATRTSTWNTHSALLSVTDLCATYIYLVSLPRAPAFSQAEQVLLCNHTHCHTRFQKANRMRTMYVPGSVIHVHNSYITWTSSHSAQIVLKGK